MIVYTTDGREVNLVDTDKKSLFDSSGIEWARCPEFDSPDPFLLGYRETRENAQVLKLTKEEMKRVIDGVHAMRTPTTVQEMRAYTLGMSKRFQQIVDEWSDQMLREILIDAEDRHHNPGAALEAKVYAIIEAEAAEAIRKQEEERARTREAKEGPSVATGAHEAQRTARSTPKRRTQAGSLLVAFADTTVVLTPKQVEFLERLSECPGWEEQGTEGQYVASQYTEELSDTMNPMAVGAVLTTLREKGLLTTEKSRMGGIKVCLFKLTPTGVGVYNILAHKEEQK